MTAQVSVVDYDCGNLRSIAQALEYCGASVELVSDAADIARAKRLLLPGVGAFGRAMASLRERAMVDPVHAFAFSGRPFLGICVGMQLMFSESDEFGKTTGLDLLPGRVRAIPGETTGGQKQKIPHNGWNTVRPANAPPSWDGTLMDGLAPETTFYFVHSFAAEPEVPDDLLAETDYGGHRIAAVVRREKMAGCQFHPEKSGEAGLQILRNFIAHD